MSFFKIATSASAVLGALFFASKLLQALDLLWTFVRPSSLSRYAHTTSGRPPWALVTGATGGIGGELSHQLAQQGFNVILHGRTSSKLEALQEEFEKAYPQREFRTLVIDVGGKAALGDKAERERILASLEDINLTVVVNNAGGATDRTITTLDNHSPERVIYDTSVNVLFPLQLTHITLPLLIRNSPSLILNIGSLGDLGLLLCGSYAASKLFLSRLSEVINEEMKLTTRDVEVLCVKVANVVGTGQSIEEGKGWLKPDARTAARAVLARVGCGKGSVVGYWAHAVQAEVIMMMPVWVRRKVFADIARGMQTEGLVKEE
jgi:17beta-estradiol 17-dehydrogenase / very-long-chain 3-oxoacyl-CoA reductase